MDLSVIEKIKELIRQRFGNEYSEEDIERLAEEIDQLSESIIKLFLEQK